mmetsp:Transcript_17376/g.41154  ORF Transcript_17376/g.41154 Transcript_17376/m.41154 type:complete len:291 (-) Transcript_17376:693-1565(-)
MLQCRTNGTVLQSHHRVSNENEMDVGALAAVEPVIQIAIPAQVDQPASDGLVLHRDAQRIVRGLISLQRYMKRIGCALGVIGSASLLRHHPPPFREDIHIILNGIRIDWQLAGGTQRQIVVALGSSRAWKHLKPQWKMIQQITFVSRLFLAISTVQRECQNRWWIGEGHNSLDGVGPRIIGVVAQTIGRSIGIIAIVQLLGNADNHRRPIRPKVKLRGDAILIVAANGMGASDVNVEFFSGLYDKLLLVWIDAATTERREQRRRSAGRAPNDAKVTGGSALRSRPARIAR